MCGPQTAGELRIGCERLHHFADISAVESVLNELAARPAGALIVELPRLPGARENRWAHMLSGTPTLETPIAGMKTGGDFSLGEMAALKVAEVFRMLEALYPGRVDLGIGRAPGGDARTAQAVGGGRLPDSDRFPEQVWELVGHLDGTLPPSHPFKRVRAQPEGESAPQVWLLGSSDYSGALAAQLGLRFAFAHFINAQGGDEVTQAYRAHFQACMAETSEPTPREAQPHAIVCTFSICAESDAEAERLAASIDLRRLHMARNIDHPVPTLEEAERHAYSEEERRYVMSQRARAVIGGPEKCRREIEELARRYGADEVMVLTITGDYASRTRSCELLAEVFALQPAAG